MPVTSVPTRTCLVSWASAVMVIHPSSWEPFGSDMIGKKWSNVQAVSNRSPSATCQMLRSSGQVTCCGPVWTPNRMARVISPPCSAARLPFAVDVVEQDIVAQPVGAGEERAAAVHARHLLDERNQVVVIVEHEGVDHDVLAGAALHLQQSLLERFRQRWIEEDRMLPFHVCRGFAVGDDDDLLVPGLVPVEELASEHQPVLDVRPVDRL